MESVGYSLEIQGSYNNPLHQLIPVQLDIHLKFKVVTTYGLE